MQNKGTLIIAEAGVNHNGELDLAYKLCDEAKKVGVDVIKFQTYITEDIITREVEQAEYQKKNSKNVESQYEMLKRLELSYDDFRQIKTHCDEIGIVFASTGDTPKDVDALVEIGVPFLKIGSGDTGNIPFLKHCGSKGLPIILSTGMSTLSDVEMSLSALVEGGAKDITLLHCTTNYPCKFENVNLKAMDTLKHAFGYEVGYSDHTVGIEIPVAAVARGARVIEKHFTLDRKMDGPDHVASTEPEEFRRMVEAIRNVEKGLGSSRKKPTAEERCISRVVLKRIVAKNEIEMGDIITENNICVKRSSNGIPASAWNLILGAKAKRNYSIDEGIEL